MDVEVTNVSLHGFWLTLEAEELFVPFSEFPWFRDAPIGKLTNVQRLPAHHLYWPDLDVDLAVESIRHPEKFPLVSHASTGLGDCRLLSRHREISKTVWG